MIPSSLGEVLVCCSLVEEFKLKHDGDMVIIVPQGAGFIAELYAEYFHEILEFPMGEIRELTASKVNTINSQFNRGMPINLWPQQYLNANCYQLFEWYIETEGAKGLDFIDMYRHIMKLPVHSKVVLPDKKKIKNNESLLNFFRMNNLENRKFVVLNTGNNTTIPATKLIWTELANRFYSMGYRVIQNEHRSFFKTGDLGLDHVLKVDLDLPSLYGLIENAEKFVTGSNGGALVAAALGLGCDINILLPEIFCENYDKGLFNNVKPYSGSNYFLTRDLISPCASYAEWICGQEVPYKILADDICSKNKSSQYLFHSQDALTPS